MRRNVFENKMFQQQMAQMLLISFIDLFVFVKLNTDCMGVCSIHGCPPGPGASLFISFCIDTHILVARSLFTFSVGTSIIIITIIIIHTYMVPNINLI